MQFYCEIQSINTLFENPRILPSNNKEIINKEFSYFLNKQNFNISNFNLDAYQYLLEDQKILPRKFLILKEITKMFSLDIFCNVCIFANNIESIKTIQTLFSESFLYTKNKLCNFENKHIIHNYHSILDSKDNYELVIINFENLKELYYNIIAAMYKQFNNSILIFSVPTVTTECYLSLLSFVSHYYNITIIKPLFTSYLDDTKYVICRRRNKHPCFKHLIENLNHINMPYFTLDVYSPSLYLINKITKENMVWRCHFLNILLKNEKERMLAEKQNKLFVAKWIKNNLL